jgi:putative spermidine/putrescine transport system substrate-binding protein
MRHSRTTARIATAIAIAALPVLSVLAGCSGGDDGGGKDGNGGKDAVRVAQTIGQGEGALTLVTWPGYAENGSSDPRVDWVSPFEERTKCRVNVKYAATTQDIVDLMSNPSRRYDGVTAPPEVAGRLIAARQVTPVNPDLIDGHKDLEPRLRGLLRSGGRVMGVPFVWGVNQLMYDPKVVRPAPTSWAAMFDPAESRKYRGRLVMRDTPMTIGDAALYLKSTQRSLKIKDPFELTRAQLDAATNLLTRQHTDVQTYWRHPSDAVDAFATGDAVLGEVWPYHVDVLTRAGRSVAGVTPREGATGWADSWMIGARAQHPNCMYQWLNWITSPDIQQQVAEWDGVAPANPQACSRDRLKVGFCTAYHVGDRDYLDKVTFAKTPMRACGDGRDDCTDYTDWMRAWTAALR